MSIENAVLYIRPVDYDSVVSFIEKWKTCSSSSYFFRFSDVFIHMECFSSFSSYVHLGMFFLNNIIGYGKASVSSNCNDLFVVVDPLYSGTDASEHLVTVLNLCILWNSKRSNSE